MSRSRSWHSKQHRQCFIVVIPICYYHGYSVVTYKSRDKALCDSYPAEVVEEITVPVFPVVLVAADFPSFIVITGKTTIYNIDDVCSK